MTFVLLDVGANWGTDSLAVTRDNPHYRAWAFEPTPELHDHLVRESEAFRSRYTVEAVALSDYDGSAPFNVAAHHDWGTSSLLAFNDGLEQTWPGRTDFYVDRVIEVPVRRFDTWWAALPVEQRFEQIDFFHCDTQGSDLMVLRGMGDLIEIIRDGVVESPANDEVKLYRDQPSREAYFDFFADRGFEVYRETYQQNEYNLYFRRKR